MAKLKTDINFTPASGKINGQVITRTANGVVLRNIVQPSQPDNTKQRVKRFTTAAISAKWKSLTLSEQQSYRDESVNYLKLNEYGQVISRHGYGLFLYLSQNLELSNLVPPSTAPPFAQIVSPRALLITQETTNLTIISGHTKPSYAYALFVDYRVAHGRMPSVKFEKFCGMISAVDLGSGINVYDMVEAALDFKVDIDLLAVRVSAIDQVTGNRDNEIDWITTSRPPTFVSAADLGLTMQGHQFTQDGYRFFGKRGNRQMYYYTMRDAWFVDTAFFDTMIQDLVQITSNFVFDLTGSYLTVGTLEGNISKVYVYELSTPYDISTIIAFSSLSMPGNTYVQLVYMAQDGKAIVYGNKSQTFKYDLTTAFDLNTATNQVFNFGYSLDTINSGCFSTDGLTYFWIDKTNIYQVALSSAFNIAELGNPPIKSFDYRADSNFYDMNFVQLSMPFDGSYFSIHSYNVPSGYNSVSVFKFTIPFNL